MYKIEEEQAIGAFGLPYTVQGKIIVLDFSQFVKVCIHLGLSDRFLTLGVSGKIGVFNPKWD